MNLVRRMLRPALEPTRPLHEEADAVCVARFVLSRDEAAFTELLRRHGPLVAGVCRRVLSHQQDAEDAMQATFLVLARDAWRIHKRDSVGSWLFGVALSVARKARQHHQRERQALMQVTHPETTSGDRTLVEAPDEVACLPEPYRTPLVLCWPLGSVAGRLARAKDMLKPRLIRRGLAPTTLALLSGMGVMPTLSATQLAEAAQRALSQSQSAFILSLARTSYVPWGWIGVVAFALMAGGLGLWWSNEQSATPISVATQLADELTIDKLQGQWAVVTGGWDGLRIGSTSYVVKIKGNTLTMDQTLTADGLFLGSNLANLEILQAWGTPLTFSIMGEHLTINFPYPNDFLYFERTKKVLQRNRSGLIRLKDGMLEIAIGCKVVSEKVTVEAAKADVPRPTEYAVGPQTFYMKLRRVKPEELLQGWWLHTLKHEVTLETIREDFLIVRDNKLAKSTVGKSVEEPLTFQLTQRGFQLILTSGYSLPRYDPVKRGLTDKQPLQQLIQLTDHTLKLATFGKVVDRKDFALGSQFEFNGAAYYTCPIPENASWESLEQLRKDYNIEVVEYLRSSKDRYQLRVNRANTPTSSSSNQPQPATTLPKLFRLDASDALATLQPAERVHLQWIAKPGAEPVTLLENVIIKEVSKLSKPGNEQLVITLLLTPNESRLLELFLDGGKYQVKRVK
jgi:DNA-directed RNA polymerase specialized sigma24 family protein